MASNNYFFKKLHCGDWYMVTFHLVYFMCIGQVVKNMPTKFGIVKNLVFDCFLSMHAVRMHVWFFVVILNIFEMTWEESLVARVCYCWHDTITLLSDIVSIPFLCHTLYYHKIQDVNKHVIVINNVIRRNGTMLYYCSTFVCVWNMSTW